jgi:predicted HicB family RNase H-like nuclease
MHLRSLAAIAICIPALVVVGCGGDDETSSTTTTTTAPTQSTGTDTTGDADTSSLPDASTLREQFNQQLLQILTTTQGMSQEQAQCAVKELETRITDEQIQQAIADAAQTGQSPQDLIDEAFQAGADCAKK